MEPTPSQITQQQEFPDTSAAAEGHWHPPAGTPPRVSSAWPRERMKRGKESLRVEHAAVLACRQKARI
jgi:hypothetical protein